MNPRPEDGWNGPGRELRDADHLEESVYCVTCGTIFVRAGTGRDCPSCSNRAEVERLEDRIEELADVIETLDGRAASRERATSRLEDLEDRVDALE